MQNLRPIPFISAEDEFDATSLPDSDHRLRPFTPVLLTKAISLPL